MNRFLIALLLICCQTSITYASTKDIETMLVRGSKFLFQNQVSQKKLLDYNGRFYDGSQVDCGVHDFKFCFQGRQDVIMSVLLRSNYSTSEIYRVINARSGTVKGISLDCTGFTKNECLRYSGHDLEVMVPKSAAYSFDELDEIARRNFDASRTWMTCDGLSVSECKKLVIWDVQLDIPSNYSQKEITSLINLSRYPERLYIQYQGNLKDALNWTDLGTSMELPYDLSENEYESITNHLDKKARFKVSLQDMNMGAFLKGSSFHSGIFRWK